MCDLGGTIFTRRNPEKRFTKGVNLSFPALEGKSQRGKAPLTQPFLDSGETFPAR